MAWTSISPNGTLSVKANRIPMAANTLYIEQTMGNSIIGTNTVATRDHFWDVGNNEDGRHRFIQSVGFTSTAAVPNDVYPVLGTGMQTVLFPLVTNGETQWFHKNEVANAKIYQVTPNFLTGSTNITSSFATIVAVPANVYGDIYVFRNSGTTGSTHGQAGWFKSNGSTVETWAWGFYGGSDPITTAPLTIYNLEFGNGSSASGLNIRARTRGAASGNTWQYRITYRAI